MTTEPQKRLFKTGSAKGLIILADVHDFDHEFVWILFNSYYSEPQLMRFRRTTERQRYFTTEIEAKEFLKDSLKREFKKLKLFCRAKSEKGCDILKRIIEVENFETI